MNLSADSFTFSKACAGDLPQIAFLEAQCFHAPWTLSMLEDELEPLLGIGKIMLLAWDENNNLAGYLCGRSLMDSADLLRIAVRPDLRRLGIAKKLIQQWIEECRKDHVETFLLEVRSSNQAAQALYRKIGFVQKNVLHSYYQNPSENGVLMSLEY